MTQQQEMQSVITDEMRAAVGKKSSPTTLEVDKTGCRMFARAVGHTDQIFYDEEHAKSKGYRSIVAPPGFFGTPLFKPGGPTGDPSELGSQRRGPAIPYKRVLNGGTDYEYFETVCAGDVLTARSKISGYQERTGSIGPMLITTRETTYTNQDGKVVGKMYGTVIQY
jgi:hypothetical protein